MEISNKNASDLQRKISTLIFMDLETTGLPFDVGKKNVHITEMSFVAIDRSNFEEDRSLRILNKLSLCIRPRSVVSPGAMQVTGLYNDNLEKQEEFDDSVPKLLEYFFRRLQPPICLLAHNGNKFDFPVLQAELKRINFSLAPNILCADTLEAFRSICLSAKMNENKNVSESSGNTTEINEKQKCNFTSKDQTNFENDPLFENDDKILSEDLEIFTKLKETPDSKSKNLSLEEIFETPQIEKEMMNLSSQLESSVDFLSDISNEKTPVKSTCSSELIENVNKKPRKRKIVDPLFTPTSLYHKKTPPVQKYIPPAKRSLFPESYTCDLTKIKKFTLENLYREFFNENPPQSHYAEVDCISLSKVCQKINQEFLKWIDENNTTFCNISALW